MSHKSALQAIAGMEVDHTTNTREVLAQIITLAREELTVTSNGQRGSGINKREAGKQAKDRKRAAAAIMALERVLANPNILQTKTVDVLMAGPGMATGVPCIPDGLVPAVEAELARMRGALDDPERLRGIYRRNEARR